MLVVTGATGHIGNVLVRQLVQKGFPVRVLVLPGDNLMPLEGLPVETVEGDVTDYTSLVPAFAGAEAVFHLAGIVYIGSGRKDLLYRVNVTGTQNVVNACLAQRVKRLVYTSSIHAFPELPAGQVLSEHKDFNASKVIGTYGKTKAMATQYVLEMAAKGLDAVVVHPTGVIGPYEYRLSHTGQLIRDFLSRRLVAYVDGGYDFVDVRDVADGIVCAYQRGRSGENYILSGEYVTVRELLTLLEEITGLRAPKCKIPLWLARATAPLAELYYAVLRQKPLYTAYSLYTLNSNSLTSCKKAKTELGYNPRPLRETIKDTVEWLQKMHSEKPRRGA